MPQHITYTSHLILSLFDRTESLKSAQLYHIVTGKRTASTLYQALDTNVLPFFALFGMLTRKEFDAILSALTREGWIDTADGQVFSLTASGQNELTRYFNIHYLPVHVRSDRYLNLTYPMWERLQLVTQVFSEKSYGNSRYIPVIKQHAHQRWIKEWIREADDPDEKIITQLSLEWKQVFESMDEQTANMLAQKLSGHGRIGATHRQAAKQLMLEEDEMNFYFLDTLHALYRRIENRSGEFPIFYSIFEQTNRETYEGLSESAWITWKYLTQQLSIEHIARQRRLKLGTVREHVIEMAIVKPDFPIADYVPERIYTVLHKAMSQNPDFSYQDALDTVPELAFYHYRLVQIERRKNRASRSTKRIAPN